ncbi:MAG: FAD-dependent oxidoreductase [Myxococcota bacterium]
MTAVAPNQHRVAVLGAGLSGLRAATELARRGFEVVVYEARSSVGGRVGGEWCAGHWMDSSWPVLGGGDGALASWVRELELGDALLPLRPVQTTLLQGGEKKPVEGLTLSGAARIPGPRIWERAKLLRFARLMARYDDSLNPMFPERASALDFRSVRDHVSLYFGPGALEFWLTPELQSAYGDHVEELSRVALLQRIKTLGIGAERPGLPGLPRRPLLELAQTAAENLDIRRSTAVSHVSEQASGGFEVETESTSGERATDTFEAVVVTLGAREAARVTGSILTPAERDFFAERTERTILSLSVALDGVEGGLPQEIRIPRREGSAISSIVIEPGQLGGRVPEGRSQIVALARDAFAAQWRDMSGDVVTKNLLSSLELALPGIGERVRTTHLGRARVPFFSVGSYRRLANFQKVQRDRRGLGRRLYWAGDYLSGPTFEASTLSGLRAAEALVTDADFE